MMEFFFSWGQLKPKFAGQNGNWATFPRVGEKHVHSKTYCGSDPKNKYNKTDCKYITIIHYIKYKKTQRMARKNEAVLNCTKTKNNVRLMVVM